MKTPKELRTSVTCRGVVWHGMSLLAFVLAINIASADEKHGKREPKITLSPAELTLEIPSEPKGEGKPQSVHFKLTNLTGTPRRFCRFYACWLPIFVDKYGDTLPIARGGRDATIFADTSTYPFVRSGKSITAKQYWLLQNLDAKAFLGFGDFTGTISMVGPVAPGDYKACLSYHFGVNQDPVIAMGLGSHHLKPEQIYSGWVMSNWIHIKVVGPPAQKPRE